MFWVLLFGICLDDFQIEVDSSIGCFSLVSIWFSKWENFWFFDRISLSFDGANFPSGSPSIRTCRSPFWITLFSYKSDERDSYYIICSVCISIIITPTKSFWIIHILCMNTKFVSSCFGGFIHKIQTIQNVSTTVLLVFILLFIACECIKWNGNIKINSTEFYINIASNVAKIFPLLLCTIVMRFWFHFLWLSWFPNQRSLKERSLSTTFVIHVFPFDDLVCIVISGMVTYNVNHGYSWMVECRISNEKKHGKLDNKIYSILLVNTIDPKHL